MTPQRDQLIAIVQDLVARAQEMVQAPQPEAGKGFDGTLEKMPHLTDQGNASWLAAIHGHNLRYCWVTNTFYWWDETRWIPDTHGKVDWWTRDVSHQHYELAADFNRSAAEFKTRAAGEPDPEKSKHLAGAALKMGELAQAYSKWAKTSESSERMAAMVRWVRSEPGIPVQLDQLDADPG